MGARAVFAEVARLRRRRRRAAAAPAPPPSYCPPQGAQRGREGGERGPPLAPHAPQLLDASTSGRPPTLPAHRILDLSVAIIIRAMDTSTWQSGNKLTYSTGMPYVSGNDIFIIITYIYITFLIKYFQRWILIL